MSQHSENTSEREMDDLRAVVTTCQTALDVDERLAGSIQQYVRDARFDLIEALVEAAECSGQLEVTERVFALIRSEIGRCVIPQDDNGRAMRGTLMAIPIRVKPAIVSCLESQVPTPATALSRDAAAAIASQLPLHPRRSGDAFYVAKPQLFTEVDLRELTFERARELTVSMMGAFLEARAESGGFQPGVQVGLAVKADETGSEDKEASPEEATQESLTTVEEIPRTLYFVYLLVEEAEAVPLSVTELNDSERVEFGLAVTEWDGMTRNLLRAAFGRELEFHLDELPGPLFDTAEGREHFEWFCLVHETLSNQLSLTRMKAGNARVSVDFNRKPSSDVMEFEAEVFLTDKNERVLGSLYFDVNPGETPEDIIEGVGEIVSTLGISEYYPPSRAWWHKADTVEAVEYNGYFGPAPRRTGDA